ncbi:MAG: GNAT family N-acetyltransferase [Parvularculaceae bacterium]
MTHWIVKPASKGDLDAIVVIERAAFGPFSWGEQALRHGFSEPLLSALVATRAGAEAPDGFTLWRTLGDEAEILSIGVRPGARRLGGAQAMMVAALEDARAEGLRAMFLEVDAENEAARGLYEKLGYYLVGRRRAYYRNGHDAHVLRKDL